MSRAIVVQLRRKLPNEKVSRLRHAEDDLFAEIASKLARFADDYSQQVEQARPSLPDALGDREQDNWEPLLAIAECAGARWTKRATDAALKLSRNRSHEPISSANELLSDIREIFENGAGGRISKIKYKDLIRALTEDPEKSWDTYNRGKPITMRQVTKQLKPYGIKSKTIRFGFGSDKGFEVEQFADAFARYLPIPEDPRLQSNNSRKANENAVISVTAGATRYRIASNGE
jgi:putative DNA primase/helicase